MTHSQPGTRTLRTSASQGEQFSLSTSTTWDYTLKIIPVYKHTVNYSMVDVLIHWLQQLKPYDTAVHKTERQRQLYSTGVQYSYVVCQM